MGWYCLDDTAAVAAAAAPGETLMVFIAGAVAAAMEKLRQWLCRLLWNCPNKWLYGVLVSSAVELPK